MLKSSFFKICMMGVIFWSGGSMSAPKTAYDLAKMVSDSNDGYIGETGEMEMILISGDVSVKRKMTSKGLEGEEATKSLLEFTLPRDIAGTKLLTWSFDKKDDQQWIFIPAARLTRRITSKSKSNSFMGSEFTFEDLRKPALEKYTYSELKPIDNKTYQYVRMAKEDSTYSKTVVTISMEYLSPKKIEFYDRSGELLKIADYSQYKSYKVGKKKFWRAGKIEMTNVQTQKKSIISWSNLEIGKSFSDSLFNKRSLKK